MTRKEFESLRVEIEQQKLVVSGNPGPMEFAAQRAEFRKARLRKLIRLGRQVNDSITVEAKLRRWERMLEKLDTRPEYFRAYEQGRAGLAQSRGL